MKTGNKVVVTDTERIKLQNGETNINLSDEQLVEYFATGEDNEKLLPIPTGFPVFILCIIQGKRSPVRVMICWLAQDGIPQTELKSEKL